MKNIVLELLQKHNNAIFALIIIGLFFVSESSSITLTIISSNPKFENCYHLYDELH